MSFSFTGNALTVENDTVSTENQKFTKSKLTVGGYGEAVFTRHFYSDNMFRYSHPDRYKNARGHGRIDLPHVVINIGYDFGNGYLLVFTDRNDTYLSSYTGMPQTKAVAPFKAPLDETKIQITWLNYTDEWGNRFADGETYNLTYPEVYIPEDAFYVPLEVGGSPISYGDMHRLERPFARLPRTNGDRGHHVARKPTERRTPNSGEVPRTVESRQRRCGEIYRSDLKKSLFLHPRRDAPWRVST